MKKYTVIVDEDYQAFNENCNITLDEIDLKIQALNKELEDIKNIALKNYDILDKLFGLEVRTISCLNSSSNTDFVIVFLHFFFYL